MSSNQAITTSNMFSILTNSITESTKRRDTLRIDIASSPANNSDRFHVGTTPKSSTLGTVIEKLSPRSYECPPDFGGQYLPRYLFKLTLAI
jgi:hypothetical protein